jgi:glycosyltransferase involved in cell wall biosynthesis
MAVVSTGGPRLAIAHEWLVRYAGSERVVEQMRAEFPDARLHTTLLRPEGLPPALRAAETGLLQRLTRARLPHEPLVPTMPLDWRLRHEIDDVDVVVSSSHACAKAVRAAAGIPHLCYCHTPMRYAWDFPSEEGRFPRAARPLVRAGMVAFRRWDRSTAGRVTAFLANSSAVAARIRSAYGRDATVLAPPVDTEFFTPGEAGERGERFLYVGRLVPYKRADLVVDAFAGLPHRLLVVGDGPLRTELEARAGSNVEFVGTVDDEALRDHYRRARALVFPANEDFGIVMAEAQACGAPVVSFAEGGAVDIVEDGATGWLIARQSVAELRAALARAAAEPLDEAAVRRSAERFSRARFRAGFRAAVEALLDGGQRPT